jgi:hypothetical protein
VCNRVVERACRLIKVSWHCQRLNSDRADMPLLDPSGSIATAIRARGELLAAVARGRFKPSPNVRSHPKASQPKDYIIKPHISHVEFYNSYHGVHSFSCQRHCRCMPGRLWRVVSPRCHSEEFVCLAVGTTRTIRASTAFQPNIRYQAPSPPLAFTLSVVHWT